ncbi:hypothetical protein JHK86_055450 [Glycine max]|nr:hypothetical protein JHK86_055450 [Glycine max]
MLLPNIASLLLISICLLYCLHSTETRKKIGAEKLLGKVVGQEKLQWNSYETLDEQLKQEWLMSVEQRKQVARTPSSKRAPRSPEKRRKITKAIAAKWADPSTQDTIKEEKWHSLSGDYLVTSQPETDNSLVNKAVVGESK